MDNLPSRVLSFKQYELAPTTFLLSGDDGSGGCGVALALDLRGDAVQVPPALGRHPAAAVGVLLHPLELLQGLQALAGHGAGAAAPVGRGATVVAAH